MISENYQKGKVKTASITIFQSKVLWNLPLKHFDPGLTALIAYRVFIRENPKTRKDLLSTDSAKHFQLVNVFQVVNKYNDFWKDISVLSHGCLKIEWPTIGPGHIEHIVRKIWTLFCHYLVSMYEQLALFHDLTTCKSF